ncbi:DUF6262 family protein [Alicyclobacillus dauci]|uniref:DUF6262 family protein n=1 Tax=Alicyclobacillus dauci TaxID=1475485 RepID=A0ABY6Z266_9BACL|nr:DUF6262 family protein [Alicyclobacillus dauci]WAH36411.1 DUF6262 family protein [Alicyclobacillus dauci]
MSNEKPNVTGLLEHAKTKTQLAEDKVFEAIKKMVKHQMKINFNTVSEESGVTKSFLYKNKKVRDRIEFLRQQQEGLPSAKMVKRNTSDASKDVIIATLKSRNQQLENELKKLRELVRKRFGEIYKSL